MNELPDNFQRRAEGTFLLRQRVNRNSFSRKIGRYYDVYFFSVVRRIYQNKKEICYTDHLKLKNPLIVKN